MIKKLILLCICLFAVAFSSFGQQIPVVNHYYLNSAVHNPSYFGTHNYSKINLTHRQQWAGLEDAPVTSNLNISTPLSSNFSLGMNILNDERGLITTSSLVGGASYKLYLNQDSQLRFGLALGMARNSIDISRIDNLADPVFIGALDKSFYFDGQLGVSLLFKGFDIGLSIPRVFDSQSISNENIQQLGFAGIENTVSSISYLWDLNKDISFKPMVVYRTSELIGGQIEGNGTLYFKNFVWIGGMYRESLGGAAHVGFKVNDQFDLGYSFEFGSNQVNRIADGTHEFHISLRLGKNKDSVDGDVAYLDETAQSNSIEEIVDENAQTDSVEQAQVVQPVMESKPKNVGKASTLSDENKKTTDNKSIVKAIEENEKEKVEEVSQTTHDKKLEEEPVNVMEESVDEELLQVPSKVLDTAIEENQPSSFVGEFRKSVARSKGELGVGYYVVVGAFSVNSNAEKYAQQMINAGYDVNIGFANSTSLYYIYVDKAERLQDSNNVKLKFRKINEFQFRQTWVLQIR